MTASLRVVSGLAVAPDGNILMGKRPKGKKRGELWELPGGKLDLGESPEQALAREWKEELCVDVEVGDFIASAALHLEVSFFIDVYEVRLYRDERWGNITAMAHDQVRWVDPQHMIENEPCSPAFYLHWPYVRTWMGVGVPR